MKRMLRYGLLVVTLASLALGLSGQAIAETDAPAELVAGNNAFAFALYQQVIANSEGNLIFSPYSISQAFGMVVAGARGDTEQQILDALHFTLPPETLHPTFGALNADLNSREAPEGVEGQPLQLNIANSLWGQVDFPFLQDYLDLLQEAYSSELNTVDFAATEEARVAINDWIEDKTEDKIQDMIPEGALTPDTRLALVNAIYFNAGWQNTFAEADTQDDTFTLLDGSAVTVPMMTQEDAFAYWQDEGFQVVELAYVGGETAMLIILPDEGTFADFEATFDAEQFEALRGNIGYAYQPVRLVMPRFEYASDIRLNEYLVALGITDAFSDTAADFSGMYDANAIEEILYISAALHKAFIGVDEAGTEAAAATAIILGLGGGPAPEPLEVRIDRPFLYVIYDKVTGSILFMGRTLNPAEE